jgi:hypothetical protein
VNVLNRNTFHQIASQVIWFSFCQMFSRVVCVALLLVNTELLGAQHFALPEALLDADQTTWRESLNNVYKALTNTSLEQSKSQKLASMVGNSRQEAFDQMLSDLFGSQAYADAQADAWLKDHFQFDTADAKSLANFDRPGWDTKRFRNWLVASFRDNTRFDAFVQSQLVGASDANLKLPTYAWYLAGQKSRYKIDETPTPIESNLVLQFQTALDSIQKTEAKDFQRLSELSRKDSNEIKRWWQAQKTWPKIPNEEITWSWPSHSTNRQASELIGNAMEPSLPLRVFREWTLVFEASFSQEIVDSKTRTLLFIQSQEGTLPDNLQRMLLVELEQGRLGLRALHDPDLSGLAVKLEDRLPANQRLQIAIINDGLGQPDSIRILVDGTPQAISIEPSSKPFYKEIVSGTSNRWGFGKSEQGDWKLEQFLVYRLALSVPECRGLADCPWLESWEDFDEVSKSYWVEHYARRVDPQWRYQRESRSHYVANLAAIRESVSMLPVLDSADQPIFLLNPKRFPVSLIRPTESQSDQNRSTETRASDWRIPSERFSIEQLAQTEIHRTWRSMQLQAGIEVRSVQIPDRLTAEFVSDWDRKRLLKSLAIMMLGD